MKKNKLLIFTAAILSTIALSGCNGSKSTGYSNSETPLIFSTQEVDGVFNPFFSTSATDSSVTGLTQISMLGNDKDGKVTYGEKEAVVVLDYETRVEGSGEEQTTTYNFVLKNSFGGFEHTSDFMDSWEIANDSICEHFRENLSFAIRDEKEILAIFNLFKYLFK